MGKGKRGQSYRGRGEKRRWRAKARDNIRRTRHSKLHTVRRTEIESGRPTSPLTWLPIDNDTNPCLPPGYYPSCPPSLLPPSRPTPSIACKYMWTQQHLSCAYSAGVFSRNSANLTRMRTFLSSSLLSSISHIFIIIDEIIMWCI